MTSGGAGRTGASTDPPASLRGGGFGLAATTDAGGFGAAAGAGLDAVDGGFGEATGGAAALAAGALAVAAAPVAGALVPAFASALAAGGRAGILACRGGAFAGGGRLAAGAETLGAGFLAIAAALGAGRLAAAALAGALAEALRRAVADDAFAVPRAPPAAGRTGRLAASLTAVFGFERGAGTLRVAVACFAGAAFFDLAAKRAGLLTALGAVVRFPAPLAGVDAFIPAISPSRIGRERGGPSTRLRAPPEDKEPATPWAAGSGPA